MPDPPQADGAPNFVVLPPTPPASGAFVFRMPFVQEVTLFGVIGTLLSVIGSAITLAFAIGGWKADIESHLKNHDKSFDELNAQMKTLDGASRDAAKDLAAIQAILSEREGDHKQTTQPSQTTLISDMSAKILANEIAKIGESISKFAAEAHGGIPINLQLPPTINVELKPKESPSGAPSGGLQGQQKPEQQKPDDARLEAWAKDLRDIETTLLNDKLEISRRSREELLLKVMGQLAQVEALRAHASLPPQ